MDMIKSYGKKLGGVTLGVLVGLVVLGFVLTLGAPYAPGIVDAIRRKTGLNPQA